MSERARASRSQETARVPGLRHTLHPGTSPGRDDGLVRRRLRGVLSVSPPTHTCRGLNISKNK